MKALQVVTVEAKGITKRYGKAQIVTYRYEFGNSCNARRGALQTKRKALQGVTKKGKTLQKCRSN